MSTGHDADVSLMKAEGLQDELKHSKLPHDRTVLLPSTTTPHHTRARSKSSSAGARTKKAIAHQ